MDRKTSSKTERQQGTAGSGVLRRLGRTTMLAGSLLAVGMGAAQAQVCHPDNPYDSISTSFHQSVAQRTDGGWAGWGQGLDKGSNALSPTDITSDDFAGMGEPLRMTTASSTTNHQTIALTANGLYVWGSNDIVFANSNTYLENAVSGVRKVKDFPSANISGLPTGTLPGGGFYDIQPDDVTMMTASYGALAIVAKVGSEQYAWLFTSRSNADGWLGVGRNKWELVQTKEDESDPVPLSDVKAMRVQNGDTASSGAVMVHAGDKVYTFGNSVYLGGGDNKITPAYATEMKLDALNGEIPKIIGVTGNGTGNSFFILTEADTLWSVGDNSQFQLGQSSALGELKEWGKVRIYGYTSGGVNEADNLAGKVKHFSVQEHEKGGTGTSWGASGLLIADISAYAENADGEDYEGGSAQVFTWGTNNGQMIGRDGTHNLTSLDGKNTPAFWGHHGAGSAASVTNGANAEGYYHVGIPLEYKDSVDPGLPHSDGISRMRILSKSR